MVISITKSMIALFNLSKPEMEYLKCRNRFTLEYLGFYSNIHGIKCYLYWFLIYKCSAISAFVFLFYIYLILIYGYRLFFMLFLKYSTNIFNWIQDYVLYRTRFYEINIFLPILIISTAFYKNIRIYRDAFYPHRWSFYNSYTLGMAVHNIY